MSPSPKPPSALPEASVTVVGNGNVGSQLTALLARNAPIGKLILVEPDRFEEKNLASQNILPADIGRPKVHVQAERARAVNPRLVVETHAVRLDEVPPGRLRAQVIAACVDTKSARREINTLAHRLRVPWVDTGVDGETLRARVHVYPAGENHPCLECTWNEKDYDALEVAVPCERNGSASVAPTNAPAFLGAFAASLQANEIVRILEGSPPWVGGVLHDLRYHKQYVMRYARRTDCAFDHQGWNIQPVTFEVRLAELFQRARRELGGNLSLRVAGSGFATRVQCEECGRTETTRFLEKRLAAGGPRCCDTPMAAMGFYLAEWLPENDPDVRCGECAVANLGLRRGDFVTVGNGSAAAHFEIGGDDEGGS